MVQNEQNLNFKNYKNDKEQIKLKIIMVIDITLYFYGSNLIQLNFNIYLYRFGTITIMLSINIYS